MSIIVCAVVVAAAIALIFFTLVHLLRRPSDLQEVHWFSQDTHPGEELHDGVVRLFHQGYRIHLIIPLEYKVKTGYETGGGPLDTKAVVTRKVLTKAVIITTKQR